MHEVEITEAETITEIGAHSNIWQGDEIRHVSLLHRNAGSDLQLFRKTVFQMVLPATLFCSTLYFFALVFIWRRIASVVNTTAPLIKRRNDHGTITV